MTTFNLSIIERDGKDYIEEYKNPLAKPVLDTQIENIEAEGIYSRVTISHRFPSEVLLVAESPSAIQALLDPTGTFTTNIETGITASTTQTQAGGYDLTKSINVIEASANAGDAVVLPAIASALGQSIQITNTGANTVSVFPASGESIDALADDAVDTNVIAVGETRIYYILDATTWVTVG